MESNSWPHAGHPKNHTIHLRILSECFSNLNRLLLRPLPWGPFQSSIIHSNAQPLSGWKTFPDIQPTPTLTQLHTISSSPVTGHRSEETCYLLLLVPRVKDSIVYYHCFLVICHLPLPNRSQCSSILLSLKRRHSSSKITVSWAQTSWLLHEV